MDKVTGFEAKDLPVLNNILHKIDRERYLSSDGTKGVTANVAVAKVGGGTRTLHYKDGLYTGYTDS
ncbi:MAG: hypothetical protein Q8O36_02715 [Candidatus Omnitrophota bacterium]|nr:hypothetical protein [Candidatus Omnitrophota bacterium]